MLINFLIKLVKLEKIDLSRGRGMEYLRNKYYLKVF